jgi:hypothetical protein|tara:strand:+ start:1033 stop:1299 length:267 start_codon:yes stop_codon:yes gene_type:complete
MTKQNITCYLSEVGHKNFHYPTDKKAVLKKDCVYEKLSWVCPQPLIAIKTKISCLSPMSLDKRSVDDIIFNNNSEQSIIVWVDKNIAP